MAANLDLRKAHLSRVHGDIMAVYTWVNDERALILIPHRRPGAPWYIVMESAGWKYDEPGYLVRAAIKACEVLGLEPSKPNWLRVGTIINEGLPDLVRMPSAPEPDYIKRAFGELKLVEDGKIIAAEDMRERDAGISYG